MGPTQKRFFVKAPYATAGDFTPAGLAAVIAGIPALLAAYVAAATETVIAAATETLTLAELEAHALFHGVDGDVRLESDAALDALVIDPDLETRATNLGVSTAGPKQALIDRIRRAQHIVVINEAEGD